MNARNILNRLMQASGGSGGGSVDGLLKEVSSRLGSGTGKSGGQRARSGDLDIGKLGTSALALLVGSKRGRRLGGRGLKYGAIAGIGMMAWKAWQNHQADRPGAAAGRHEGEPIDRLDGEAGERRSLEILQAMILAARADGHVDEEERAQLAEQIDALGADQELHDWMERQFEAPLDADLLARQADSPQAAREMYIASLAIVDERNPMEQAWLTQLADALGIEPELAAELDRQVRSSA